MRHEKLKSSLEYQIRDPKVQKLGKIKAKQITQSVNAEDFETGVKNVDLCTYTQRISLYRESVSVLSIRK